MGAVQIYPVTAVRYYEYLPADIHFKTESLFDGHSEPGRTSQRGKRKLRARISELEEENVNIHRFRRKVLSKFAQIRQAVMNLITNFSEALGENEGVISVTVADVWLTQKSPATDAPNVAGDKYLRLVVADTGCRMTQEIKAKIFKPFFTLMSAGRSPGLSPVQGIIRGHGGTINVVSASEGCRTKILLPCNRQPAQRTQDIGVSASRKTRGRSGTILVIEDEEILRVIVAKVLRERGFSVIETGDGKTGVDLFQKNESEVSVVVLDMTLPSLSGREVLVQLQRIRPDVKVILTTAYSENMALLRFDGQRPWHFLRKPYHLSDLVELVRDAVG